VLLSTYNGEKYLPELLDSVLAQRGPTASIYVRDDGSSDSTLALLKARRESGELEFEAGMNMGPARSFLNLVFSAPEHDFYAFADQDDIWLPDKLPRALAALAEFDPDIPQLYFSNATNVDADGAPTGEYLSTVTPPGLGNALVQCFSIGATMVFNHAARTLLVRNGMPLHMAMHDWWTYLMVSSFGRLVYDPEPSMLYRQHGQNVFGSVGDVEYVRRHWRAVWQSEKMLQGRDQANDLLAMYQAELGDETRQQLDDFTAADLGISAILSALQAPVYKQKAAGRDAGC
jgi:glycosyltransferase involved in cell wall biosynthesis